MTKAKRMIEIKKELRKVKKRMNLYNSNMKNNEYFCKSIEDYCFPTYVTDYEIITKNRIRYIISNITPKFPDINFKDIIYVNKYMGYIKNKNNCWDTDTGYYNSADKDINTIDDIYSVVNVVGDYED